MWRALAQFDAANWAAWSGNLVSLPWGVTLGLATWAYRRRYIGDVDNAEVNSGKGLVLESGWLPPAEFDRLVAYAASDLAGLTVTRDSGPGRRGVDPTIVVAVVSGVATLLLPFVTKLAERLFKAEPRSSLSIEVTGGTVVIDGTLPPEVRAERLDAAVSSGAARIRIEI